MVTTLDLAASAWQDSRVVWEDLKMPAGRHALMIRRVSGQLPVDRVDFLASPTAASQPR
jgi:hypothetical protein